MTDEIYMARALELARRGRFTTTPNPNVGCVIVRDDKVVGEGYHLRAGEPHAEVHALRMAGDKARGATVYVTLEPCSHHGRTPPCCDALIAAGVSRVVVAMQDPNPHVAGRGLYRLQQAGIAVSHGVMMPEAEALNRGFFKRMRTGFPWVQLKMGASLDGRTALASGESQWITSPEARRDVQRLRAQSSAILTSSATVLADNPSLTVRWDELDRETQTLYGPQELRPGAGGDRQPSSRYAAAPPDCTARADLVGARQTDTLAWPENVEQLTVPLRDEQVDLVSLLLLLGQREINSVWVEAGARLAGALLSAGVVDELIIYLAPKLLGDTARGLCHLPGLAQLSEAPMMKFSDIRQVGPDLRLILTPDV